MKQRINKHIYLLFLPLLIFMYSCRVGKAYQRPELELPEQFNRVSFSDTSSIADIEWKNFFTDPTLQGLIEKGIRYNHDLMLAVKRLDVAQQQLRQSKLLLLPDVSLLHGQRITNACVLEQTGGHQKTVA